MKTIFLEEQVCPYCGHLLDTHNGVNDNIPKPGDISICFYCGEISVFSEYLSLLKCPEEHLKELTENQLKFLKELQEKIKNKN